MKHALLTSTITATLLLAGCASQPTDHDMTGMDHDSSMTMDQMVGMLEGKTGDAFDKAFIEGMIPHHQGAIDMAELAKKNAKHQEIKDMADAIISAQQSEIDMMKQWQKAWGYEQ